MLEYQERTISRGDNRTSPLLQTSLLLRKFCNTISLLTAAGQTEDGSDVSPAIGRLSFEVVEGDILLRTLFGNGYLTLPSPLQFEAASNGNYLR